ncbi:hypothetical protein MPSI1_003994 [Malassezia psittaci]|uniref:Uncharacterized protein n=1 Tax=Malassezia psittaci TaxID=1821823 RepID=A0AAF0JFQ3_9BASI|nr:hypothetical protein MPSI1_003994 [Malassezia psittaci]
MRLQGMHSEDWSVPLSLVLNPEYRVSPPIRRPYDMHPLPESIEAYCVYPFSLEERILSGKQFPLSQNIAAKCERHKGFMEQRKQGKIQQEKDRMLRMAPGWIPDQVLEPMQVRHSDVDSEMRSSSPTTARLTETTPNQSRANLSIQSSHTQSSKPIDSDLSALGSPIYSVDAEAPVSHSGATPLVNPTAHVKKSIQRSPSFASGPSHNGVGRSESIREADDEPAKLPIDQLTRGLSEL